MQTVAVWATRRHLADPAASVATMVRARVNECSIMVNDFSADRAETPFRMHDQAKVGALASACRDAGIRVTLTTWVMPHESFIHGAASLLLPLMAEIGADTLVLDAEEPWVRATGRLDYADAAECIVRRFAGVRLAVTAIGTPNTAAIRPLAMISDLWIPQCYVTDGSDPNLVSACLARWSARFGSRPASKWQVGLAAYKQPETTALMAGCIDAVRSAGVDSVAYWSLTSLAREDVAAFVASLRSAERVPELFPTLELATMPIGVSVKAVARVQALLLVAGHDPGPLDGKPGRRTRDALRAFQESRGLVPIWVVTEATWRALLSE